MNISYITCVNNFDILGRELFRSYGINADNIIILDNTSINIPISYNYNYILKELIKDPKVEWLVFCHQDFYVGEDLSSRLNNLDKNYIYGPIGVSSQGMLGKIMVNDEQYLGKLCDNCVVDTLDAMCMIVHKDTIIEHNLSFDENFKFHFYVEDFCLQAREKGIQTKILQLNCQHKSMGKYGMGFLESRSILIKKWKSAKTTTGLHTLFDIEHLLKILERENHI